MRSALAERLRQARIRQEVDGSEEDGEEGADEVAGQADNDRTNVAGAYRAEARGPKTASAESSLGDACGQAAAGSYVPPLSRKEKERRKKEDRKRREREQRRTEAAPARAETESQMATSGADSGGDQPVDVR